MGHCVQAFIGEKEPLTRIQKRYGESAVVELASGLSILPLIEELYDAVEEENGDYPYSRSFQFLTKKIGRLAMEQSTGRGIIYFETEYFGGQGEQGAMLVVDQDIKLAPAWNEGSINEALRLIGVKRKERLDEFDSVGLGCFRSNEDWIEQPVWGERSQKFKDIEKRTSKWWQFWK